MQNIAALVQGKVEDNYYTPDMPLLYKKRRHLLFVYGTLKKGFLRHSMLKSKKPLFVGDGWTTASWYKMEYTNGKNPYPVATFDVQGAKIHGEVYLVPPEAIVLCDFYESNGAYYDRRQVTIDITNANNPTVPLSVPCWIYEGNKKHWDAVRQKQTLRQAQLLTRKKDGKGYYTFMKKYANGNGKGSNASLRSV